MPYQEFRVYPIRPAPHWESQLGHDSFVPIRYGHELKHELEHELEHELGDLVVVQGGIGVPRCKETALLLKIAVIGQQGCHIGKELGIDPWYASHYKF